MQPVCNSIPGRKPCASCLFTLQTPPNTFLHNRGNHSLGRAGSWVRARLAAPRFTIGPPWCEEEQEGGKRAT
ncbi:hypothetical protein NDU88_004262 [Pleurodeles waltl]|uniref:Uncharacterized protein n=1 Tax=Pleurodeles waltl TaxID=8319 RepID=A0AAV7L483_PLEWA|nr:hypothetical protein NDU88_004262 [Pleurodeles waltl]